jgi:thioredoxin 1
LYHDGRTDGYLWVACQLESIKLCVYNGLYEEDMMVIDVTDQNFEAEVVKSSLPALVDLWAPWCGPCRMIAPIVEKLAEEYDGRFKFCRLNVDENQQTAARYKVMAIPTLIFFKGGEAVDTVVGSVSKQSLQPKIDSLL